MPNTPDAAPVTVEREERVSFLRSEIHRCDVAIENGDSDNWWRIDRDRLKHELDDLLYPPARLAATPSDRARVDGEEWEHYRYLIVEEVERQCSIGAGSAALDPETGLLVINADIDIATLARVVCQAAEQGTLAAEKRVREWKDKTADWERMAREIEREKLSAEQRVRALVEGLRANSRMLSLMMPQVPMNVRRNMASEYQTLVAQTGALLPAADGGSGEKPA